MESHHKTPTARVAALAAGAVVLLVLGALIGYVVGDNGSSDDAGTTGHNQTDVRFARMMVPHHEQALEMARLADTRAASQDVKTLATAIESAQQPEIDRMNGWLNSWGAAGADGAMGGMDHGATGDGIMSEGDMTSLAGQSGTAFDTGFLELMIKHHEGAIAMAQDELAKGQNAKALALAASIVVAQQGEINQMTVLLRQPAGRD